GIRLSSSWGLHISPLKLAVQRWGDFHQILQATRALIREGKRTGKQAAAAYQRVCGFCDSLLTYRVGHGLLRGPMGAASIPAGKDPPPALLIASIIIATLNTRGCRMGLRRSQVLSFLREGVYSVVFLKETHTDPASEDSWRLEWGDRVYFSHLTVHTAGVVTLFSSDLRPEVLGVAEAMPGRLLHLRVCMEGVVVNLVNVYAPTPGLEWLCFYQQASAFLSTLDPRECLVLGGDFNTTLEERDHSRTEQCPSD
ncbi:unnamed protein product, partial [Natator depressus]